MIIFVPTEPAELTAWRAGAPVTGDGFAATTQMLAGHQLSARDLEEAEHTVLGYASVAGLLWGRGATGSRRLVAAVDASDVTSDGDVEFGGATVAGGRWRDVVALFVDEPEAAPAVRDLTATLTGRELTDVLTDDAVLAFLAEHDLLWYLPTELGAVLGDAPPTD